MSAFLDEAATAEAKENTPLTRLPTVKARKEPKVKPPPPQPPSTPGTEAEGVVEGAGEKRGEQGVSSEFGGMDKHQAEELLKIRQAEREAARRKAMDEEVRAIYLVVMYGHTHIARVWINRVRLPNLLVVS